MKVSVVIATYKRPLLLMRCLSALFTQDFKKKNYEIIVVDDGADEGTRDVVHFWQQQNYPKIRYIAMAQKSGPAAARNIGWKSAEAEIIAFTDDDTIPDVHWLREGIAAFKKNIAGVNGKIIVPLTKHPTDFEKNLAGLETAEFATANCFYTKMFLKEINGFDENFPVAWREDADVFLTLLSKHKKFTKASNAIVIHPVKPAPWYVSLTEQKKSMYNALLYKKHPTLYYERVQTSPPWDYYVIVFSLLMFFVSLPIGITVISILYLFTWIGFTLRLFTKRIVNTSHEISHVFQMLTTSFAIPWLSVYWRLYGAVKYKTLFF